MKEQIIVAIGREHGSGGHYIAELISKALGIKLYDKGTIEAAVVNQGYSQELISQMDERPINFFRVPANRKVFKFHRGQCSGTYFPNAAGKGGAGRELCGSGPLRRTGAEGQSELHQYFYLRQPAIQAEPYYGKAGTGRGGRH